MPWPATQKTALSESLVRCVVTQKENEHLPFDPWTLGGVDDMIRHDLAFALLGFCDNPKCDRHKLGTPFRLDLYPLIKRFGRSRKKVDVLFTCIECKYAGRDRTQTRIAVGMKDHKGKWRKIQRYCREPHRNQWYRPKSQGIQPELSLK